MPTTPFNIGGQYVDLSSRIVQSTTVAASPSAASETTIANLTLPSGIAVASGVLLMGWAAYTCGTNGVSVNLKIKRSTTVIAATGAATKTAANLYADDVNGFDTGSGDAQAYTLTMTVASGSAVSTVSAVLFCAIVV